MYPSGPWRGYWEQQAWGRQAMDNLVLRFEAGLVERHGKDVIGAFTFSGRYDDQGKVTLIKHYIGRHEVLYEGTYDGEGMIFGRWSIWAIWSGPFALSPTRRNAPADVPIREL
jgi:hypothetical protein